MTCDESMESYQQRFEDLQSILDDRNKRRSTLRLSSSYHDNQVEASTVVVLLSISSKTLNSSNKSTRTTHNKVLASIDSQKS